MEACSSPRCRRTRRRPERACDNHTWKTNAQDVERRLRRAGFSGIDVTTIDVLRELGGAPYPPADDKMMYVRCWAMPDGYSPMARIAHAMGWLYQQVQPDASHASWNVVDILRDGHALCAGYAAALGQMLGREGYPFQWVSMEALGHLRGRGPDAIDTHEVVTVCVDGAWVILDPMTNTIIPHRLEAVLADPSLAPTKSLPDDRYVTRSYGYYDTPYWYSRVVRYSFCSSPKTQGFVWRRNRAFVRSPQIDVSAQPRTVVD